MRFLVVITALFGLHLSAQTPTLQQGKIRQVYQGPALPGLTPMRFGLSSEQAQKIRELTGGRVRFDEYHYVDIEPGTKRPSFDGAKSAGVIYPDVPPPVIMGETELQAADPKLKSEWWIEKLNVPAAWKMASGRDVMIADCDAGYFWEESDLLDNMLHNLRYDLARPNDPYTVHDGGYPGHGTSVAAIMAGVLDGKGTSGIAYGAKVVPLQNYNYDGKDALDKEEATAMCVLHALTIPGVQIIVLENQMANGSSEAFAGTRDAVRLALHSGVTVIGAAGNASVELREELADDTGSIIVGALRMSEAPAGFSNYGARITVGAFGEKLHTLEGPNGRFADFGGTSGATPQVAAAAALMLEVQPLLLPEQIREIFEKTRVITGSNDKTGGKLDVLAAVRMAQTVPVSRKDWRERQAFRQQLVRILE